MGEQISIQWFPGHMTKARRMIAENVKYVDAVCEVIDARIPISSRNPDLDDMTGNKPRLVIMNRADQANPEQTRRWKELFSKRGLGVLETDCKSGAGTGAFPGAVCTLLKDRLEAFAARGQTGRTLRIMVVGIPNVGKSTFINKVAKRKAAAASDKPGVTRGRQWIIVERGLELLDTPGILWPKFDSQEVGENLAFTGAVKDDVVDRITLAANLCSRLADIQPEALTARYKLVPEPGMSGFDMLEKIAKVRGFLISGGEYDFERCAAIVLDEFRGGKLGRITLETAEADNGSLEA